VPHLFDGDPILNLKRAILITPSIVDDFDDTVMLSLWVYILCKANVTPKPYDHKVDSTLTITLTQGQMFLCLKSWAKRMSVQYMVAYRRLKRLQERNSVVIKTVNKKGIIVTVVNLSQYQTFANYKKQTVNDSVNETKTTENRNRKPYHSDTITQNKSLKTSAPKARTVSQRFADFFMERIAEIGDKTEGHLCRMYNQLVKAYSADEVKVAGTTAQKNVPVFRDVSHVQGWMTNTLKNMHKRRLESTRHTSLTQTDEEIASYEGL